MSVINDMLRDLDKRQAPEVSQTVAHAKESLIEPQTPIYKKWLVIVAVLVVTLLIVLVILFGENVSFTETSGYSSEVEGVVSKIAPQPTMPVTDSEPETTQVAQVSTAINENRPVETSLASPIKVESKLGQEPLAEAQEPKALTKVTKQAPKPEPSLTVEMKKQLPKPVAVTPRTEANKVHKQAASHVEERPISKPDLVSVRQESETAIPAQKQASSKSTKPAAQNQRQAMADNTMQVSLSPAALDLQMAEKAMKLISQRRETEAYRELYAFIGEHEEDTESRTVLASYLLQEERIAEVGDVLLNAPINTSPKLRQMKARWYAAQGEHKLAIYTLSSNLPKVEQHTDYYVLLAAYYQRLGWAKEASNTYASLLEFDDSVADWWAGLGLASDRNNERTKAIYAYQQALELKGLSTELFNFVQPRLAQLRSAQTLQTQRTQ